MKSISIWYWWLMGAVVASSIALCLWLPSFGLLPLGLNRDEAALGYNAYSLLKTGHDEYGAQWPVSITSFGDQKLPGYVYTLIPFIALLDLNPFTVRLPSLLAGLVVINAMGILSLQLTDSGLVKFFKKVSLKSRIVLSWLTMILVAVSPWHNHFSRVAYEAHLAMALFVSGLVCYTAALMTTRHQRWLLLAAATLWSGTLLTYHSYHVVTPLFVLGLLGIDFQKILKLDRVGLGGGVIIGLITLTLLFTGGVWSANQQKNQGITPFKKTALQDQATSFREYLPGQNALYEKVLVNSVTEGMVRLSQNLVMVPTGSFLFVNGTAHDDHNPGNITNFHLFTAPFIILGCLWLWEQRTVLAARRLGWWLIVALVPSALTISPQHTVRFSPAFPLLELLAALGIWWIWLKLSRPWQKSLWVGALTLIISLSVMRHVIQYDLLIPQTTETHERYQLLGQTLAKYQAGSHRQLVTQSPSSSPYIWYLFESKYDPTQLTATVTRYQPDQEGFQHVKQIGNIYFETIAWNNLFERALTQEVILVFKPQETPVEIRTDNRMHLLEEIKDSKNQVVYEVWLIKN